MHTFQRFYQPVKENVFKFTNTGQMFESQDYIKTTLMRPYTFTVNLYHMHHIYITFKHIVLFNFYMIYLHNCNFTEDFTMIIFHRNLLKIFSGSILRKTFE